MPQLNLNTEKAKLTESDIDQILSIITKHSRLKTYNRLRSILTYSASKLDNYGIYNLLIKEACVWSYCSGQSYTDDIRTLRECILGKRY